VLWERAKDKKESRLTCTSNICLRFSSSRVAGDTWSRVRVWGSVVLRPPPLIVFRTSDRLAIFILRRGVGGGVRGVRGVIVKVVGGGGVWVLLFKSKVKRKFL